MRVIAGLKKGIALRGGHGDQFRPTAQVVKGSVFDTLYAELQGAAVLDLFAGSGSMGIEALSRGAARAVFVEQERSILRALRTNLQRCSFPQDAALVKSGDAVKFLGAVIRNGSWFDLIFADPPYKSRLAAEIAGMLNRADRKICKMLIVESDSEIEIEKGILEKLRTRKFGQTIVTYFRYGEDEG